MSKTKEAPKKKAPLKTWVKAIAEQHARKSLFAGTPAAPAPVTVKDTKKK